MKNHDATKEKLVHLLNIEGTHDPKEGSDENSDERKVVGKVKTPRA